MTEPESSMFTKWIPLLVTVGVVGSVMSVGYRYWRQGPTVNKKERLKELTRQLREQTANAEKVLDETFFESETK